MKVTAITVSVCVVLLSVLGILFPKDPYFYVISSNLAVIAIRLGLCAALMAVAYESKFKTIYGQRLALASAIFLAFFGLAGLGIAPIDYSMFNFFKPMDYMFMLNCSFVFALAGVTYPRGSRNFNLPRLSRPRSAQLRLSLPRGA